MAATWTWLLCDATGAPLAELTTASGRRLTYRRNHYPEASFTLSHADEAAQLLLDHLLGLNVSAGIPILKCYRQADGETTRTLRFAGRLAPFEETVGETATLTPVFRGPFSTLIGDGQSRGRFTAATRTFSGIDAGQIAKTLIDEADPAGIATTGTIEATKTRDRTYEHANVGEAIRLLTEVLDGFDFEIEPVDSGETLGELRVYARQGEERQAARFEFGSGTLANVAGARRQVQLPVNTVRVIGEGGLVGEVSDPDSVLRYGTQFVQVALSDVSEQSTLDDRAQALLRPDPIRVVSFTPEATLAPQPWDDFWLGDTVPFFARSDAFYESINARVNEITVVVDDEGFEASETPDTADSGGERLIRASIQVEAAAGDSYEPAPTIGSMIGALASRVHSLERTR